MLLRFSDFGTVTTIFWARVLCSLAAEDACFRMRVTLESSSFVPWFSTFVFRNVPGTVLECVCICWFERNSYNLDRASEMRDSIRLNSWDSFLVILPSISSETCVIYSSLILGTDVFRDWPFLGCSSTYSVSLNFWKRLRARYVNTLVESVYMRTTWTHL